jgi:[protein-PII] uridylyltransferase
LLHDITYVFAEMQLDIRHARIVTLGDNVVDTFYLCEQNGAQITGIRRSQHVEHALLSVI